MRIQYKKTSDSKSRIDTYIIPTEVQKEMDKILQEERARKYIRWTPIMDAVLVEYRNKGAAYPTLVKILAKAFPTEWFTLDRIYRRLAKLGLLTPRHKKLCSYEHKARNSGRKEYK